MFNGLKITTIKLLSVGLLQCSLRYLFASLVIKIDPIRETVKMLLLERILCST